MSHTISPKANKCTFTREEWYIGLGFVAIKASEGELDSSLIQVQIAVCICSW